MNNAIREKDFHESSLRTRIRKYHKVSRDIQNALEKAPYEWGKYQSLFNFEVSGVFRQLMEFEKAQLAKGAEDKVYKLKKIFVNRIRDEFLHGEYIVWSLKKPFGYAGDYKIIDDIYRNQPVTTGFARLFDNYFQMSSISVAVRNRKDDFEKIAKGVLKEKQGKPVRIMNLGSGPARELYELFTLHRDLCREDVVIDCVDNDQRALDYAKDILREIPQVQFNFIKENVVRFALNKNIASIIPWKYHLIYSTGLFDYFDDRVTLRLLGNLKKILASDGRVAISDVRDKYSNPSVHFMEWVGDWNLIYRDDDRFRQLFVDAGFNRKNFEINYEQQGILQYIVAVNPDQGRKH